MESSCVRFRQIDIRNWEEGILGRVNRRAQYFTLTKYYSNLHLSLEEEHSDEHRTPLWYLNLVYPAVVWATSIIIIANLFFLGDAGKVHQTYDYSQIFQQKTFDMAAREPTDLEGTPARYEFVYQLTREQVW